MTRRFSNLITGENPNQMYAGSRNGVGIDRIVIHHNATTNKDVAMSTWYTSNGNWTSAHYEVTPTEIIGCVEESYSAYHCGGAGANDVPRISNANERSIGIENVNSTGAPSWSVDPRTIANCAKLVRDICDYYGIPCDRQHVLAHREVTATACPGGIDVDQVVALANGTASSKQYGALDLATESATGFNIAGWQASDQSKGRPYFYLFLMDKSTNKEIMRKQVTLKDSPDVAHFYGSINGSSKCRFETSFDIAPLYGKKFYLKARYSADPNGNNDSVDYDFPQEFAISPENHGSLDTFMTDGKSLFATGWNANDLSQSRPYHFIIVMDASTNREITRVLAEPVERKDVVKAYPTTFGALTSGFNVKVPVYKEMVGNDIYLISRYSADKTGNSNYSDFNMSKEITIK